MKDIKVSETFKAKKAAPDISIYTDDLLGPSLSTSTPKIPNSIKMLNGKRKIAPLVEPKKETPPTKIKLKPNFSKATEEENEETVAPKDSKLIKSDAVKIEVGRLSNREQAIQMGLNHDSPQKVQSFDAGKTITPADIPKIVAKGVSEISHIVPQYHKLSELSDNVRIPLKAIERPLFSLLTSHSIHDIQILANIHRQGPNSADEIGAVKRWLYSRGRVDKQLIDLLPIRFRDFKIFNTEGITHLLIDDSNGQFIFSWPSVKNQITK